MRAITLLKIGKFCNGQCEFFSVEYFHRARCDNGYGHLRPT